MARALAPEVRVNALCPGGMLGAWTRKILTEKQYEERVARAKTEYPLQRGIWPIDVARAALFLVEGATVMTGELIRMDCGQHLGDTTLVLPPPCGECGRYSAGCGCGAAGESSCCTVARRAR